MHPITRLHNGKTIGPHSVGVLLMLVCLAAIMPSLPSSAQDGDLSDCAPTRLEPWAQAQVPEGQGSNRIRNAPDLNGAIMGEIPVLVPVDILDGPFCEDGVLWWEVEARGERGFTAEASGDEYFLERINNECETSQLIPGGAAFPIELNDRDVDLYERPRLDAPFAATATTRRDTLSLNEAGVCAQDTRWWQATAEDGSAGWVIETQQQARNLAPAPRLERADFGVIVEPSTQPPPPLGDYALAYANKAPDVPFSVEVEEIFIHPLDGEPERISRDLILFREDVYWSPDGSQLAYEEGNSQVVIHTLGEAEPQIIELGRREFMGWSPDGAHLLWKVDNDGYTWGVINVATGAITTLAPGGRHALGRWVDANTFELMNRTETPDGPYVVATVTIDPPGVEERPLPSWTSTIEDWAFAPDGRIAFLFGDQLAVLDPATGDTQMIFNLERVDDYAWSPSGDRIMAIAGFDDTLYVIDVTTLEAIPLVQRSSGVFGADSPLRWSPDGVMVAYRQGRDLMVQPADGSAPPTLIVEQYGGGTFPEDIRFRP